MTKVFNLKKLALVGNWRPKKGCFQFKQKKYQLIRYCFKISCCGLFLLKNKLCSVGISGKLKAAAVTVTN